jgi:acyl-CoA synthetase (NDP forming)
MAGDQAADPLRSLREAGSPVTEEPRAAIRALAGLSHITSHEARSRPSPITGDPASWGIHFIEGTVTSKIDEAVDIAQALGHPVVLKVVSGGLSHKTEVGGVRLNLKTADEVRSAYAEIMGIAAHSGLSVDGIRVERFRPGVEVIVGGIADPSFGPIVSVGLGGVLTELLGDVVFAVAPVDVEGALDMIERLKGQRLLHGFRGTPPADLPQLASIVSIVSRGLVGTGLKEIEINPLVWDGEEWIAVDFLSSR